VHEDDIPEQVLAEEIEAARAYAVESGKPESIIDRIVEGRLNKFKDETCLLRQPYIRDDEITVNELLLQNVAAMGENVIIRRIERWELGELSATDESD
jgi:elongation factor Ts